MQDRALLTRQNLITAAAVVFARRGYAAATMSHILAEAGVTKGALYFHFRSKHDLARAIFAEDARFAAGTTSSTGSPLQDVIDLSHGFAASLQTDPVARASVRLAIELTFVPGEEPSGYDTWQQAVTTLLRSAREDGELAAGVDPEATAAVLVGSFTGLQLLSEAASQRGCLQRELTDWWRLLIPGLASPAAASVLDPAGSQAGHRRAEPGIGVLDAPVPAAASR